MSIPIGTVLGILTIVWLILSRRAEATARVSGEKTERIAAKERKKDALKTQSHTKPKHKERPTRFGRRLASPRLRSFPSIPLAELLGRAGPSCLCVFV